MAGLFQKLKTTLEMIKFEHTLFALPFAFLGAILAANGLPTWRQIVWITVAMFGARSAAMTFNRIVDRDIDAKNPRTAGRELPAGKLSVGFAWAFLYVSIGIFLLASYSLNWLTFALSPVALICVLGYSYAKRFTAFSHVFLGLALAISPSAAWIAVRGSLNDEVPILLSVLVLMWTAGFDVMYACQDFEFDRKSGLRSIPARYGIKNSLWIARLFHFQAFIVLCHSLSRHRPRLARPRRRHRRRSPAHLSTHARPCQRPQPNERRVLHDKCLCERDIVLSHSAPRYS